MTVDVGELRKQFRATVEATLETGVNCPPGLDFDAPRPGIAPGNLQDPPSQWQSLERRVPIGDVPAALRDHPRFSELLEGFDAEDYLELNPDVRDQLDVASAAEHFEDRGFRERRPYSKRIWSSVRPAFYRQHTGLDAFDDSSLRSHYAYKGRFEDRFPNDLTAWVANTRVHLWQMGKVGSLSIQQALREQHNEESVHLHFVDTWHRDHPEVGVHYSRLLHHHGFAPKIIVCGVRDPIERVVSGYFQEAESLGIQGSAFASVEIAAKRLSQRIIGDLWNVCNWFGHQFFCGYQIFDQTFDADAGFSEHALGNARLWLYRQDRLRSLPHELAKCLGYPSVTFPSVNVSSGKQYGGMYRQIAECIDLPDRLIDQVYASRYAKHFGYEFQANASRQP